MAFDFQRYRRILACPKCHAELIADGDGLVCTNPEDRRRYPVLEDIPRLLVDESGELSRDEWRAAMERAGR